MKCRRSTISPASQNPVLWLWTMRSRRDHAIARSLPSFDFSALPALCCASRHNASIPRPGRSSAMRSCGQLARTRQLPPERLGLCNKVRWHGPPGRTLGSKFVTPNVGRHLRTHDTVTIALANSNLPSSRPERSPPGLQRWLNSRMPAFPVLCAAPSPKVFRTGLIAINQHMVRPEALAMLPAG